MRTFLPLCLLMLFTSVASAQQTVSEVSAPLVVLSDRDSHVTKASFRRIDDQAEWTRVWLEHLGTEPAYDNPNRETFEVDFKRCIVVAIFGGTTVNTAGYKIDSVIDAAEAVVVRFEASFYQRAGPDGGAEQVTPYAFVVLPKTGKPIVLEEGTRQYIGDQPTWRRVAKLPPRVAAAEQVSLSHPDRVEIPDDIPFVVVRNAREKDGTVYRESSLAAISYQKAHFDAWQECLMWVASPYHKIEDFRVAALQTNDEYLLRGLRDGADDCMARIQALRQAGMSEDVIRQMAQRTLGQTGVYAPAPPPPVR